MGDEGFNGPAIVADTYRRLARELHTEAAVLESQARAFSDAAQRIEDGAEPSPLRMVDGADGDAAQGRDIVEAEAEDKLLRAVVDASMLPPSEMYRATLEELGDEAGWDPQDFDEVASLLSRWDGVYVEMHRTAIGSADGRQAPVFMPLPPAFARLGVLAPSRAEMQGKLIGRFVGSEH